MNYVFGIIIFCLDVWAIASIINSGATSWRFCRCSA